MGVSYKRTFFDELNTPFLLSRKFIHGLAATVAMVIILLLHGKNCRNNRCSFKTFQHDKTHVDTPNEMNIYGQISLSAIADIFRRILSITAAMMQFSCSFCPLPPRKKYIHVYHSLKHRKRTYLIYNAARIGSVCMYLYNFIDVIIKIAEIKIK